MVAVLYFFPFFIFLSNTFPPLFHIPEETVERSPTPEEASPAPEEVYTIPEDDDTGPDEVSSSAPPTKRPRTTNRSAFPVYYEHGPGGKPTLSSFYELIVSKVNKVTELEARLAEALEKEHRAFIEGMKEGMKCWVANVNTQKKNN